MEALRAFWAKNLINKLVVVGLVGLFCCCPVGLAGRQSGGTVTAAPTTAPTTEAVPTAEATATSAPEATATPNAIDLAMASAVAQLTAEALTSPTPEPSPTLVPPTATPSAEVVLLALVRDAAAPNMRDGRWDAQRTGDEVRVTLPLNLLGSNEQIVRLNQTRMAGVVKSVFDTYADVQLVNVIGTSPVGDVETPGISVLVTREQYAAWSGRVADLPGWQVGQRFR